MQRTYRDVDGVVHLGDNVRAGTWLMPRCDVGRQTAFRIAVDRPMRGTSVSWLYFTDEAPTCLLCLAQ